MSKRHTHGSATVISPSLSAKLLKAAAAAAPQTTAAITRTIAAQMAAIKPSVSREVPKEWTRPVVVRGQTIDWITQRTPSKQSPGEWPVRTGRSFAAFRTRIEVKPPNTINGVITNPIRYAWIVKGRNVAGKGRAISKLIQKPLKKAAEKLADELVDELTDTLIKGANRGK